ncbi:hypothetical protein SeMB42_g00170 [Synchytrium endobioticum]|uniref:Uncharacterized protein n=1 Tax=Synchytrium endobioticum TaxID=286115 RepID=A0A507DUK9_9FUNG|nr:hypothetical protein SeMB42_g00170 [Synchytrium endobioticum]
MAISMLSLPPPPPLSASAFKDKDVLLHRSLSLPKACSIEPVGFEYLAIARRKKHKRTLSEDYLIERALEDAASDDAEAGEIDEETEDLLMSDPDNWKNQDHYKILGLSKSRWKATEDDIRRAYRRKVLKHHPDKKNAEDRDDSFFKCIQKAWEVLGDSVKRRQWDSIDPEFDDTIPSAKIKGDFFEIYGRAFTANSRYSKKPAPSLGDMRATKDDVEAFYEFWYNFDSWRGFEALDEDDPEAAECREERRYLERKNKAERTRKKKEEKARIMKLVDQATKLDPRIKKFKEEERAAKEAIRREKEEAKRAVETARLKQEEEVRLAREKADAEERARLAAGKKERDAKKRAARKEKKAIQNVIKDNNYFFPDDRISSEGIDELLRKLDEIVDGLEQGDLERLRSQFEIKQADGQEALSFFFEEEFLKVKEKQEILKAQQAAKTAEANNLTYKPPPKPVKGPWSPKELQVLIKAVKMFPGGTVSRWEKIADYVIAHGGAEDETPEQVASRQRAPEDCVRMSKSVLLSGGLPNAATARAVLQSQAAPKKQAVDIKDAPTTRFDTYSAVPSTEESDTASVSAASATSATSNVWTPAQQSALEAAMKKHTAAMFTKNPGERWEKVAGDVEGKNVKEVKARIKELSAKAKKK